MPPAQRAVRPTAGYSAASGVFFGVVLLAYGFIRAGGWSVFALVLGVAVGGGLGLIVWVASATTVLTACPRWVRLRRYADNAKGPWVDLARLVDASARRNTASWTLCLRDADGRRLDLDPDLVAADPVILGYLQAAARHLELVGRVGQLLQPAKGSPL